MTAKYAQLTDIQLTKQFCLKTNHGKWNKRGCLFL